MFQTNFRYNQNRRQKADDVQNNVGVMDQSATVRNLLNSEIFEMTPYNLESS